METDDVDTVATIEDVELSAWSVRLIEAELEFDNSILLVACSNDCVIGWCCARVIGSEAELLKIGVAQNFRRLSVGTNLLYALLASLKKLRIEALLLEVRSQNEVALGFYHCLGFTPVGRRINYYSQPGDDALILRKNL